MNGIAWKSAKFIHPYQTDSFNCGLFVLKVSVNCRVYRLGLFKKTFFKFNSLPTQIVRLVIEAPHTKFQLIWFTRKVGYLVHFSTKFFNQRTSYLSFFCLILLKLHFRPSLNQFAVFVLKIYKQKNILFLCYFDYKIC